MIELSKSSINISSVIESARDDGAGALDVFIGTVRNATKDKRVKKLEFEAYEKMALNELEKIAQEASKRWPIKKISIVHALGIREIGETAVAIAVSTPHRQEAFEACRFCIDTLKETVPIWKKEIFEDGEVWVGSTP